MNSFCFVGALGRFPSVGDFLVNIPVIGDFMEC